MASVTPSDLNIDGEVLTSLSTEDKGAPMTDGSNTVNLPSSDGAIPYHLGRIYILVQNQSASGEDISLVSTNIGSPFARVSHPNLVKTVPANGAVSFVFEPSQAKALININENIEINVTDSTGMVLYAFLLPTPNY